MYLNLTLLIVLLALAVVAICIRETPAALRDLAAWAETRALYLEARGRLQARTAAARERRAQQLAQLAAAANTFDELMDDDLKPREAEVAS